MMLSDFEKFFSKDNLCRTGYGISPFAKARVVIPKVTLIDHQRAKSIEVMLARIKLPHTAIADALMNMDDEKLGHVDQMRIMLRNVPTAEEIDLVKDFTGDLNCLGSAEHFISHVSKVPELQGRIIALIYIRMFDMEINDLLPEIVTLSKGCKSILASETLPDLLALALKAGNILNASTFRGAAQAFRLEGLIKLAEVRSTAGTRAGPTLLHYLLSILHQKYGRDLELGTELRHCAAASRGKCSWRYENVP